MALEPPQFSPPRSAPYSCNFILADIFLLNRDCLDRFVTCSWMQLSNKAFNIWEWMKPRRGDILPWKAAASDSGIERRFSFRIFLLRKSSFTILVAWMMRPVLNADLFHASTTSVCTLVCLPGKTHSGCTRLAIMWSKFTGSKLLSEG